MSPEEEIALRQRINANLKNVYSGKYRREADAKRKLKLSELEQASPEEIQSGFIVLEARRIRKELNKLLRRENLKDELLEYAEDLQMQLDDYDAALEYHSKAELTRYVRLWNKSRKVRYKL